MAEGAATNLQAMAPLCAAEWGSTLAKCLRCTTQGMVASALAGHYGADGSRGSSV